MALRRTGPRPLAGALTPMRQAWAPESLLADVQQRWSDAVGPQIAAVARPISERGGTLTISCSEAAWAQQLDLMQTSLLAQLNVRLTAGHVKRLRCVVADR